MRANYAAQAARLSGEQIDSLFRQYQKTGDIDARNTLLEHYLYLAEIIAKKFTNRGVEYEDLLQVASVALVKAIERFDLGREIKFSSFAAPSLIGEIKNYFRDKTRMVHISRRDSEQLLQLADAKEKVEKLNSRYKTEDLAKYMNVSEERVLELMEMQRSTSVASLEKYANEDENSTLNDFMGTEDRGFSDIENRDFIRQSLSRLSEQEQIIVRERFWNNKSQKQVAEILGVSQMYISRYEKKILGKLRGYYNE